MKITCSMCTAKTDYPPRVTKYTVQELSYRKHKNWKKIFENQCQTSFHVSLEWRLSNVREPSVCLPLACRQETSRTEPDQADRVKPRRGKTVFSRRNRFLSSRKLGRLLWNTTGTRVCDRTVRNRLHTPRLEKRAVPTLAFR